MQIYTLTAPSHWASYLINGDYSGLEINEPNDIRAWLSTYGLTPENCVDCEDAGFKWKHDASSYALASDCQLYTFHKHD